ncbi:hypothetical protein D0T50_00400 [Bacteroides sp. 214]|nr:hypothetical protein [Bacteroides sp. 214]
MIELEREDKTYIEVTHDETGVISYVSFYVRAGKKSLLTDHELYEICKKYKGVIYDLSHSEVSESQTGSKTVFFCQDFFQIPFEDLRY